MDFKETLKDDMETIIDLIEDGKLIKAREKIITMDAVDIELLLDEIPREKMLRVFRMLPTTKLTILWTKCSWTTPWTFWRKCRPMW